MGGRQQESPWWPVPPWRAAAECKRPTRAQDCRLSRRQVVLSAACVLPGVGRATQADILPAVNNVSIKMGGRPALSPPWSVGQQGRQWLGQAVVVGSGGRRVPFLPSCVTPFFSGPQFDHRLARGGTLWTGPPFAPDWAAVGGNRRAHRAGASRTSHWRQISPFGPAAFPLAWQSHEK